MNRLEGSNVHWHISIVFDWKMAAVVSISILIRLLIR
jgi:hypothetical protein